VLAHVRTARARGALRSEGRLRVGVDRLAGPRCLMQARVGTLRPPPILRLPALPTHHHKQTRHQIPHAGRRKRHSAAPAGWGHRAWVHHLASCDHRWSPCKMLPPANNTLCPNAMLSH